MQIIRAAEGTTNDASGQPIFTGGPVWRRGLAGSDVGLGKDFSFGIVQFGAGARTKPHRHSSDQLLYVVAGIGKVGAGGEEHVISAGDFVMIPAGEDHWHGAPGETSMAHITIQAKGSQTTQIEE